MWEERLCWRCRLPAYTVLRVIDGDTFETTEKQLIRLANVNSPEIEYCLGQEAKAELEKLVMKKPVYLKVLYRDRFMRLLSLVYTSDGFVNEQMVKRGLAVYHLSGKKSPETELLDIAHQKAKEIKSGIYSPRCTQEQNIIKPSCNIKGNRLEGHTTKIYSLPECESYASTIIQLHLGDQWFCTEAEAKKAGFIKAGGCN